jgi:hypothetical protein
MDGCFAISIDSEEKVGRRISHARRALAKEVMPAFRQAKIAAAAE